MLKFNDVPIEQSSATKENRLYSQHKDIVSRYELKEYAEELVGTLNSAGLVLRVAANGRIILRDIYNNVEVKLYGRS